MLWIKYAVNNHLYNMKPHQIKWKTNMIINAYLLIQLPLQFLIAVICLAFFSNNLHLAISLSILVTGKIMLMSLKVWILIYYFVCGDSMITTWLWKNINNSHHSGSNNRWYSNYGKNSIRRLHNLCDVDKVNNSNTRHSIHYLHNFFFLQTIKWWHFSIMRELYKYAVDIFYFRKSFTKTAAWRYPKFNLFWVTGTFIIWKYSKSDLIQIKMKLILYQSHFIIWYNVVLKFYEYNILTWRKL